jgi:NAD(P)-dependent dehydrogenase (short-subunit alcohol dehydrogenase family)
MNQGGTREAVAVVTGAARGIGRAASLRLARQGCRIMLSGRSGETLAALANQIRQERGEAEWFAADLTQPGAAEELIATAHERFGRVDILVNSAGVAGLIPFLELDLARWQQFLDLHLTVTFRCSQAAARKMIESRARGRIVNLSSIAARMAMYGTCAYSVAKAGVSALTRAMAVELAPYGITVNAVAPGPVATEQLRAVYDESRYKERSRSIPLNRLAEPEEVAELIAFLVSERAAYITGQVFTIDGGASAVGCYSYETYKETYKQQGVPG